MSRPTASIISRNNSCPHDEFSGHCRTELLRRIQMLDFAMVEAKLYLNTHPCDEDAMRYFEKNRELHESALRSYERRFGPLSVDSVRVEKDGWSWIDSPWPWHMEV